MTDRRESKWSLDKHVPIALIIGLVAQTVFFVWYTAQFTANVESRLNILEKQQSQQHESFKTMPEKIARLEAQQQFTNLMLSEILSEMKGRK
jgi:hypothetical protein